MVLTAIERKRVELAVETLARYNKDPFISDFVKQQLKPRISPDRYDKEDLCELIQKVLLGEHRGKKNYLLRLDDLIRYLDRLQETGRQHLYLLRLPEEGRDQLLARLRDLKEVKDLLGGEEVIYQGGREVWETKKEPQLALVRHEPPDSATPPHSLLLKWIETRVFWTARKPDGTAGSGKPSADEEENREAEDLAEEDEEEGSQKVQIKERREERAATFFVIDLDSGDCELRIQALHGRARADRQKQLATYRALMAGLLGCEAVGPTVLAPAIRRVLMAGDVRIVSCSAILPDGGRFIGPRGELPPVDLRKLQAGVTLRFDWPQPSGGVGRVELDGRIDEILNLRPLLPEQHRLVLELVRRWRQEGLADLTSSIEPRPAAVIVQQFVEGKAATEFAPSVLPATKEAWIAILKTALLSGRPEPPAVEPGIDRAVREYARTHAVAEPAGSVSARGGAEGPDAVRHVASTDDRRPLEQFLGYIQEVAKHERSTYQREIKFVRSEEQWYFRFSAFAAILVLVFAASGSFLLLLVPGKLTIGAITALLTALTGRGTVLIRSYAKNLRTKRELIQDQQRDSNQTLLAIQTALAIPDPQARSRAMTNVAASLLGRVPAAPPSALAL